MSGTQIAPLFDIGPRIAAQVLGIPYDQYRPSGITNPTASGNKIATLPAWITADARGMGSKAFVAKNPTAYAMIDPSLFQVGDYFIGPFGTFFVASKDAVMPTQVVRCNHTINVARPSTEAIGANFYGGGEGATTTPILTGWPASVIQGTKGETGELKLPGDTRLAWVAILLPVTGSAQILPGDWITTGQATAMIYTVSSCEITPLGWRLSAATAVA